MVDWPANSHSIITITTDCSTVALIKEEEKKEELTVKRYCIQSFKGYMILF